MKKSFALILMLIFSSTVAFAQEQERKPALTISEWLKGLQRKISQIAPRKSVPVSTGVAGVRGAKEGSQVKLYWKGKKGDEAVSEEELAKFKAGVDLVEKGDYEGSIKQLEEFMKLYPDSPLIPDAKKTLDMVKAQEKEAAQTK